MNKQREALRLIKTTNLSDRQIGRILGMSHNTVKKYRAISLEHDLEWERIKEMDDTEIESFLKSKRSRLQSKYQPDYVYVHQEMHKKHVTLQLLWEEYRLANPENAYSYSQFTYYYREYVGKLDRSMRQTHRAGECVFVDFAGRTVTYYDSDTGEEKTAQIFIGVLGCSNYTFVYAVPSQKLPHWIDAHNRMYQFFGGVPQIVVPDNLKSAVIKAGSDMVINRTYLEQSQYYGVVVMPARVRHPKDKSKAEGGVLLAYRWILVKLRNRKFFSIAEVNEAIADLLRQLNERPFKKLPGCRRSRFEELDKPMLSPLPGSLFEYAEWTAPNKIGPDYHMHVKGHYYSVPHALVGERVEARVSAKAVEILFSGKRITSHVRSDEIGGHSTLPEHQPKSHRIYAEQTPERFAQWAKEIGPAAESIINSQFSSAVHPVRGLKACTSLRRLAKDYGHEKFESACRRAEAIGSQTVKSIRSILQRGLSELSDDHIPTQISLPLHHNVRGSDYYATGGHGNA